MFALGIPPDAATDTVAAFADSRKGHLAAAVPIDEASSNSPLIGSPRCSAVNGAHAEVTERRQFVAWLLAQSPASRELLAESRQADGENAEGTRCQSDDVRQQINEIGAT